MKQRSLTRAIVLLVIAAFFITASAADRPVIQNRDYNPIPLANVFPFVTTGVNVKIKSASIANDGTIVTRFTLTDSQGLGLDVNGIQTAGVESLSFVAAYIPKGQSQYVAYTTTVTAATSNTNPSQTQAGTDKNGKFNLIDATTGTYDYTFGTKVPANWDPTATHSIGMQGSRNLAAYGITSVYTSDDVYTWVPSGAPVTNVRDVVTEAACNQCHNPLNAHGSPGPRTKVAYCVMCHTPQSVNPDTLNTVDFKVFIHKLHMGSSLPSVAAGGKYFVVHRGSVNDFSNIVFPQDTRNCTTCHAPGTKQANNFMTNPSRAACGSCHDDVNFATGLNHVNLPQVDDNQCAGCHSSHATYDFDASVPGAHVIPNKSASLPGVVLKIQKVDQAVAGSSPVVTFQVTDKSGNPVDITKLTSISIVLGGPNTDYGTGAAGIRVSENPSKATGSNGVYTYTMTNKIPAGATGSYTISLESRNTVTLMPGTTKQTSAIDDAAPTEFYFSVDKSKTAPRRQVVATAKCAACHNDLTIVHSGARANTQECVICHNPTLSDGTSGQSVNFAVQIHSIHRGSNLANPYVLGSSNFQSVLFPGDLRVCTTCHLDGTYLVENVGAQATVASPGGFTKTTPPISAACQGCHDDKATASHALANTTVLGESCATCHGSDGQFSVTSVHARAQ
jgi:OmcA/MtrC family decaheme c-type cytochrome